MAVDLEKTPGLLTGFGSDLARVHCGGHRAVAVNRCALALNNSQPAVWWQPKQAWVYGGPDSLFPVKPVSHMK